MQAKFLFYLFIHDRPWNMQGKLTLFTDFVAQIKNIAPPGEARIYTTRTYQFDPLTINIPRCTPEHLRGGDPTQNAKEFEMVLAGGEYTINAKKDSIVLNAGFGCYVYGLTNTVEEGCALARKTLIEGKGEEMLNKWRDVSKEIAGRG